jgi:two-component system, OmpR family, KDP operon response regulator KdpE
MGTEAIARILVVDDEPQIRKFLRISLTAHGYEVIEAARGEEGVAKCATAQPDLVILDLGLPDLDGQQAITRIREWSRVPIIVLSVRTAEKEKVAALDRGADDYVTKPFGIHELLARVRAVLRRPGPRQKFEELAFGDVRVHRRGRRVTRAGREVRMTRKEYDLLVYLAEHQGDVVTRERLLDEVWGYERFPTTRTVDTHVLRLRRKLEADPDRPRFIHTVHGQGYRFLAT